MSPLRRLAYLCFAIGSVIFVLAGAGVAAADGMPTPVAPVAAPACPTFTTADKSSPGGLNVLSTSLIDQFRVGRHDPCFDRFVVDVAGKVGGWRVRYVNQVISDPKGDVLTVPGGAKLQVTIGNPISHAAGFPQVGHPVISARQLAGFIELRSVIFAGSFENVTSLGVGVHVKHGFRVFVLPPGPGHLHTGMLVIDVAQH